MGASALDLGLAPIPPSCTTYSNCYWNLLGNGNIAAGVNFLGTVAGELDPLEFRVNNNRAMLYTFTGAGTAPNITGGFLGNVVTATGGTIAGGGQMGAVNRIDATFGTVSGGRGNTIAPFAFDSTVGGGVNNRILQTVEVGTIAGGSGNTVGPNIYFPAIGGGSGNVISGLTAATIAGGMANSNLAPFAVIGGGLQNRVTGGGSTIAGGSQNRAFGTDSAIGGGRTHVIEVGVVSGTVSGGISNVIRNASLRSTIGGGAANIIGATTAGATVGGGQENSVANNTRYATIPGGLQASAISFGQQAYASGRFAQNGDAQAGLYVVRNTTSTNSLGLTSELFLDGAIERIHVPANAAWSYDILVVGRDNLNRSAGYHFRGVIENNAGVTILPALPSVTVLNEDVAAWNAEVIADNANDALVVRVTGSPLSVVRWAATVRTAEVVFP